MRPDVEAATARIIAIHARLTALPAGEAPLHEIEDELCIGYAEALEGDAWLSGLERRLQAAFEGTSRQARDDVRALAVKHAEYQRSLIALRRELAALRREHDRLRGHAHFAAS